MGRTRLKLVTAIAVSRRNVVHLARRVNWQESRVLQYVRGRAVSIRVGTTPASLSKFVQPAIRVRRGTYHWDAA